MMRPQASGRRGFSASTTRKFALHVATILCAINMMAWLDKANIGFAKLQMLPDLGLTETSFGLGASMFFLGYILVDILVVFILPRFKAPHILATMMFGFGGVTMLLAGARGAESFYLLRFLLGIFEGGLTSTIFFYLAHMVPYIDRSRVAGLFLAVGLVANAFGGMICGALLDLDGVAGLRGWQWLFLLTGLPTVALAVVVLRRLPPTLSEARFYSEAEKAAVRELLSAEHAQMAADPQATVAGVLRNPRLWLIMAVLAAAGGATYGLSYWLPTVIRGFGVSNTVNGLLTSVPWVLGTTAMVLAPGRVERSGATSLLILAMFLTGAVCFALLAFVQDHLLSYLLICLGAVGMLALQPLLVVMPTRFLRGGALAVALPATAIATNLGGFVAQNAIAVVATSYGATSGLILIAGITAVFAVLAAWFDYVTPPPAGRSAARRSAVVTT